jgi:hypothetical protein
VSLRAPIAVPVELRADAHRAFRLAANVGEDGLRLAGSVPFEAGRRVEARFVLPDGQGLILAARVTAGGPDREEADERGELAFVEPTSDARQILHRYVVERLELPA